jgi:hypothetical protein
MWETAGQDTTLPLLRLADYPALLPPQPVRLSPMQVRLLLRATLPQPVFDRAAALALIAYQQRRKLAAYLSHRQRRLCQALRTLQPATPATIPRTARLRAALALPRDDLVSL